MSLINDMLKDLDRRHYQPAGVSAVALPTGGHGDTPRALTTHTLLLGGLGLAIAVALAGMAFSNTLHLQQTLAADTGARATAVPVSPAPDTHASSTPLAPDSGMLQVVTDGQVQQARTVADVTATATSGRTPAGSGVRAESPTPLSREQQLARDFQAATAAIGSGNLAEAEHRLLELLSWDNGLHQARLLLAGLYVQQQRSSRAESLLASGLLHYPQHVPYARLYAQLLAAQARDSEAINALQAALPAAAGDAEFHALLAGLYQRSGKAAAAVESYRTALRLDPPHGAWWMGLGISSEQAGDAQTAATAYRQALHYPLAAAVQQFVEQRLAQLARDR